MKDAKILWQEFGERLTLTPKMLEQFKIYYEMLIEANELFNLTTITDLQAVLAYHFEDSLILNEFIPVKDLQSLADIGSGAGFPGIPLKIRYPHLSVILIEVSHKKVQFLSDVFKAFGLEGIQVSTYDWRTFLRKTNEPIDLFCARASLHPEELLRMFKPSSPYKDRRLVYWASSEWLPEGNEASFIKGEYPYKIRNKRRKLVFFAKP
jgi:16S rRNA (guanine(527)-N(7))-methyltransferase RsmG